MCSTAAPTNRTARIALLNYVDGEKRYIIAPEGMLVGDTVITSKNADIKPGNAMMLRYIPLGTVIHNVEMKKGKGAQMVRSAGSGAALMAKDGDYAQLRLPSGEVRQVHLDCHATIGQVGFIDHANISLGKAGRTRWLGRRPHNRGVVMNPTWALRTANRIQIRQAVESLFNVKAAEVNTLIMRGKDRRMGRGYAKMQNWKKAMVTLKEGCTARRAARIQHGSAALSSCEPDSSPSRAASSRGRRGRRPRAQVRRRRAALRSVRS